MALFLQLLSHYGYFAIFLFVLLSGIYVPIPAGIILIAVGILSHHHHYFTLPAVFVVALLASLVADLITYTVTRWVGKKDRYLAFVRKNRYAALIEKNFKKRPGAVVAASRFVGVTTLPVNALAGLTHLSLFTFLGAASLGESVCVIAYLALGYTIGTPWAHDIRTAITVLTYLIVIGSLLSLVFFFISHLKKSS